MSHSTAGGPWTPQLRAKAGLFQGEWECRGPLMQQWGHLCESNPIHLLLSPHLHSPCCPAQASVSRSTWWGLDLTSWHSLAQAVSLVGSDCGLTDLVRGGGGFSGTASHPHCG